MARIKKKGLDYFPLDTDFIHNHLVRRLLKREGDAAFLALVTVLSRIYSGEGYYALADDYFYDDVSAALYQQEAADVRRIIGLALEYGIFHAGLYKRHGILTSEHIQRQYLFVTKRRKSTGLDERYRLVSDEADDDTPEEASAKEASGKKVPARAGFAKGAAAEAGAEASADGLLSRAGSAKGAAGTGPRASASASAGGGQASSGHETSSSATSGNGNGELQGYEEDKPFGENINATFIPQNVTLIPHSIAKHSIAKQSKENPLLQGSPGSGGTPAGERGGEEDVRKVHREWTDADIDRLSPPADGLRRNLEGLILNLRQHRIPPAEQYAIVLKSNYGVIGHPVWKGFESLRTGYGKIRQPGKFLLSLCWKARGR